MCALSRLTLEGVDERTRPPDRTFLGLLGVALLGLLLASSTPGVMITLFAAMAFCCMLLGLFWLARLLRAALVGAGRDETPRWWPAPALVLATALLIMTDAPLRLRFELARGSFDELAAEFEAGRLFENERGLDVPNTVGTFTITGAFQVDEGLILDELHGSFINDAGFAYLPNGPADGMGSVAFEALPFDRWAEVGTPGSRAGSHKLAE